jgi:Rrf2 family transcriptional regulator, cysteine metabolism repressor
MISGLPTKPLEQKHGFLQFSQKLDYGLFLLIELAKKQVDGVQHGDKALEPLSLRTVSEAHGMSFFFMQKAAFELRKAGLIRADRGKNGGYILARPASKITLKEIVEILEGPVTVLQCLVSEAVSSPCLRKTRCQMRHGLGTVNQAIIQIFSQTSLLSLLQKHE